MGVGADLYMYVVVVQKFTFAISSPDEFLYCLLIEFYRFEIHEHFTKRKHRNWRTLRFMLAPPIHA